MSHYQLNEWTCVFFLPCSSQIFLQMTAKEPATVQKLFLRMTVLTVSEEDVSCPVPGVLRVPEVINQSFNRLKKQNRNVTTYRWRIPHCQTKSSLTGLEPCYLIWGRDQVDGLHAGQGFTPLGYIFYNWWVDAYSKKRYEYISLTLQIRHFFRDVLSLMLRPGWILTGDSLWHDVCHFTAGGNHPHTELVHHQDLWHSDTQQVPSDIRTQLGIVGEFHVKVDRCTGHRCQRSEH